MYTLEATLYELQGYIRVHGVLATGKGEHQEVLASAHLTLPALSGEISDMHAQMMKAFCELCDELAENSDPSLF